MLPNFIIGGTAAGGTSFLGAAIIQHPDIYLPFPMEPECHFFLKSWEYDQGIEYYQRKWFSDVQGEKAVGERSSSYLFGGAAVAKRIRSALPNVKLIFTLRNPIERAWGNYRFTVLQGLEDLPFLEALKREPERVAAQSGRWAEIQPHNYTGRGMYATQLRAYREHFSADQILVLKSEQMQVEPEKTFQSVFEFLGIEKEFCPEMPPKFSSMNVRDAAIQARAREILGGKFTDVILAIREHRDPHLVIDWNDDLQRRAVEDVQTNVTSQKQNMDPECREYLQSCFAADMRELPAYVSFSTDDWC